MGDAPPHWPDPRQPTHTPLTALQTGVAPAHVDAFVAEQAPQAPFGWQAGTEPPQSASTVHARQVCVAVLHVGVVPAQVVFATQATHVAAVVSHAGVAPVHKDTFVDEQMPHAPLAWQAGAEPPQSASTAHTRQACVARLHVGVAPAQSALSTQATQVAPTVSHTDVAPAHSVVLVAEHWPHAPEGSHAGALLPHSPSPAHPRHTCVARLHTGVAPAHVTFVVQATHVPAVVSHEGTEPPHLLTLVAEHAPHAPEGSQAGVAPPHSPSPAHPRHACVVVLHTGVAPPQSALATQPTHAPVPTLQTAVEPVHFDVFVAEHAPHAPEGSQAGTAPLQSTSPAHPRQTCVVVLQMGAAPPQSTLARQPTHVPVVVWQTAVAPPQAVAFVVEHCPHVPLASHAGVAPPHSPSPEHPRHVCVAVLQTGVAAAHSAFVTHATHVPVPVAQTGVAPVHLLAFVDEH
jgi:hypothetical protein